MIYQDFTDENGEVSSVKMSWICPIKYNFKTFVTARDGEILESSNRRSRFHVGTKDNVSDDATKLNDPEMGHNDTLWFKGPDFLKLPFKLWTIKSTVECREDEETTHEENHSADGGPPTPRAATSFSAIRWTLPNGLALTESSHLVRRQESDNSS